LLPPFTTEAVPLLHQKGAQICKVADETLADQETGKEMRLEENSPAKVEAELLVPLSEATATET